MTENQSFPDHPLDWRGGVPVSGRFDDPFYSLEDGLAETRHVFLAGNGLPGRFRDGFSIAELGFGTGLNFVAAVAAWAGARIDGCLRFTSFEAYPLSPEDARRALDAFPEAAPHAPLVEAALAGSGRASAGGVTLEIVRGDARETVPRWTDMADAWFLDGFAPARNPELWEEGLLSSVARHTAPGGTCATYSAAGAVRRALAEAGFAVERVPGYGRKRHMTTGRLG
ncbi:tRNA (5-methylaminomethyl-2-thiouridine)(34)-methyltransferase MnmD [Roseibacterium sp. SDUM158017]|uniref:tRNA (5-methylaminomethyl-2-thiouridine)(34)-methyltransferase MnmD n=1 Tax=Roseicyclus salinarum TaxID=3036773 RepID=UPI0024155705|nr:tRNA (5-methylaminomethyl-2-thiouridine)(34)-methyltransferase MnmD [Roseibacterium sp. SDUM158017]MDG4649437.1 tRNA (5-methylaminomethyl-2-thiouridine)(34)-methyltransferase MnmD [Roseibacterium sp. SDUM158017]